ncbi:MurR/RpiR family transcriptional regulator, partial [bacterium]|nr:MurR/RpiR family transcriptional regulator [bacterium]
MTTKPDKALAADALTRIRSHLPVLAEAEATVAHWILANAEQVIDMSMAQVAKHCGVSDTTVLRFCRRCGFHGYMDLKLSIARDLTSPTQLIHDAITPDDDVATLTSKVFSSNIQALHDTLAMIDMEAMARAVEMLLRARTILVIGVGTSSPIVQHMHNQLFRLGLNCHAQTDSYLQLMQVALTSPGDVVVGISQSGSSTDPVMTMQKAKENGAETICITGNLESLSPNMPTSPCLVVAHETRAESIASRI